MISVFPSHLQNPAEKTPTKPPIRTPGKLEKKRCHLTTKKTGGCSTLILLRPFARTIYPSSHNHGSEKLGPSNSSFLSFGVVFHFHDYARKGPGSAKNGSILLTLNAHHKCANSGTEYQDTKMPCPIFGDLS